MNKAIFPAYTFLSLDYAYENAVTKKLDISWMLIPFPKEILQDQDYCHSKTFVNDTYRRPWKRSIPTFKIEGDESLTDVWKIYISTDDVLEKRQKLLEIVPSSNPCSPMEHNEVCCISERATGEAMHAEDCWSTIPFTDIECYILQEEAVFVDYVAQYRHHLPSLKRLKSRLKTIPVQDPLPELNKTLSGKEVLLRMDTTMEKELERDFVLEEFHVLPQNAEEYLSLPCTVEVEEVTRYERSSVSELFTALQLAPEDIPETPSEDMFTKSQIRRDFIEHNTINRNMDLTEYEDIMDKVCFRSSYEGELEVPITPPSQPPKTAELKPDINLAEEVLSPFSFGSHFAGLPRDILECPEYQANIHHLLLKVPHISVQSLHNKVAQELMCFSSDESVDITLEDKWWRELGLNVQNDKIIEKLNCNIPSTLTIALATVESFTRITPADLERVLKEKPCAMKQTEIFQTYGNKQTYPSSPSQASVPCSLLHTQTHVTCNTDSRKANEHLPTHKQASQLDELRFLPKNSEANPEERMSTITQGLSSGQGQTAPYKANSSETVEAHQYQDVDIGAGIPENEDVFPISSFIVLRTKRSFGLGGNEQTDPVQVSDAETITPDHAKGNGSSSDIKIKERSQDLRHQMLTVTFTASDSQCQAYQVLGAAAEPVLKGLTDLGVTSCAEWKYASISFDHTRFFLCQQEKIVSDSCKIGMKSNRDMILYKNASFLHILVTLRDLVLMCTLGAALEYLNKAKDLYKSVLGSCLNDLWRSLRIIQYVQEKTQEMDPKITALFQWIEESYAEPNQLKILIITRMDAEVLQKSLNNAIGKPKGLHCIALSSISGNAFVDTKYILNSFEKYSCIIVNNQYIGSQFPWAYFSVVIEYDCTDFWMKQCQDLNIPHMSLKATLSDCLLKTSSVFNKDLLLHIQIPYVFLSSEELTNHPEILEVLESRYNMTFIERECSPSLQLFGKASHFALITVNESTVIILQSLEELMADKSAENLILRLVALSLQYSCCWVLLYSKERLCDGLSGNIIRSVALIHAAVVPYTSRLEDLEIKVLISPGIDEMGLLIRCISDHTLMLSSGEPYKWLDKSWLSAFPSEAEKVLCTFPCINPLVAQQLLCRGSSLQWLLAATYDQLKKLLPEVPSKVLKHFTDITALRKLLKSPGASPRPAGIDHCCSSKDSSLDDILSGCTYTSVLCQTGKTQPVTNSRQAVLEIMAYNGATKSSYESEAFQNDADTLHPYRQKNVIGKSKEIKQTQQSSNFSTTINPHKGTVPEQPIRFSNKCSSEKTSLLSISRSQNTTETASEHHFLRSMDLNDNFMDNIFSQKENSFLQNSSFEFHCYDQSRKQKASFTLSEECFFVDLSSQKHPTSLMDVTNEPEEVIYVSQSLPAEKIRVFPKPGSENLPSRISSASANDHLDDVLFSQISAAPNTGFTLSSIITKETPAGAPVSQLPQNKRKRLTYESIPGRYDGQTRLKFF
ncbi:protein shortage in chiasmata 1 ortholog isoform X2 [Hyperolius riggenbachi]